MQDRIRARGPGSRGRRPATAPTGRVCGDVECDTVISVYNTTDLCHRHRPVRYPRVRGIVTKTHQSIDERP